MSVSPQPNFDKFGAGSCPAGFDLTGNSCVANSPDVVWEPSNGGGFKPVPRTEADPSNAF